ncbi:hypothetical protein J3E69DRAFT_256270 [Trichoderma sp. SZMC 28015]
MKVGGVQPRLPKRAVLQAPVELKDLQPAPHTVFHEVPRLSALVSGLWSLDTLAVQAAVLRRYRRLDVFRRPWPALVISLYEYSNSTQAFQLGVALLLPKVTLRAGISVEDLARGLNKVQVQVVPAVCTSTSSGSRHDITRSARQQGRVQCQ